ncbi:MAG: hypothetical protein AB2809_07415 [Candidatus Thiodiazotropha sp.]
MDILLSISLFLLAVTLFGAVKLGLVNNHTLQILANIAAIIAAVTSPIVSLWPNSVEQADPYEKNTPINRLSLQITLPKKAASVSEFVTVEGYTPYRDLYHYIAVRSQTEPVLVKAGPLRINEIGRWREQVQLGNKKIGENERYYIYVIAANSLLEIDNSAENLVSHPDSKVATVFVTRH